MEMAGDDGVDFSGLFSGYDDDDKNMLYIDMQTVMDVLDEDSNDVESTPSDFSSKNVSHGESGIHDTFQLQNVSPVLEEPPVSRLEVDSVTDCSPFCSDVSDSAAKNPVCFATNSVLEYENENVGFSYQASSSPHILPGSYMDSSSSGESNEICCTERTGVSKHEIAASGVEATFPEAHSNNISVWGENSNMNIWKNENERQFNHMGGDVESEHASHSSIIVNGDVSFEDFVEETVVGVSGQQESDSCTSFQIPDIDVGRSLQVATSIDSTLHQGSQVGSAFSDYYLSSNDYQGIQDRPLVHDPSFGFLPNGICSQLWTNYKMTSYMKTANMGFYTDTAPVNSDMRSVGAGGISIQDKQLMFPDSGYPNLFSDNVTFEDKASLLLSTCASHMSIQDQSLWVKVERDEPITPYQSNFHNNDAEFSVGKDTQQLSGAFSSTECPSYGCFTSENHHRDIIGIANHYRDIIEEPACKPQGNVSNLYSKPIGKSLPHAHASNVGEKQFGCVLRDGGCEMIQYNCIDSISSKGRAETFQVEDDPDVCIVKDFSLPVSTSQYGNFGNSFSISQSSGHVHSQPYMVGSTRQKAYDEQNILQVALQDLSQPNSEVSPPDGLLAVPLLRHQRIALSWMVQKETSSLNCSGGILADDQGLGKTLSTIALILKERAPIFSARPNAKKVELKTSNLDGKDDLLPENVIVKKESETYGDMSIRNPAESKSLTMQVNERPTAGTLIVCPTSVLRQWAEELRNRVTSLANLSVLVYHGSNRTKDPHEVAKYDVVLTTYSIVSMEVPKQPLANKDDEVRETFEDPDVPSRKRKGPSNLQKSVKKRLDSAMFEAIARPLAKVSWFRVVLDEAQSIKNHRTQVARACSGLQAKRRWCLSGTPIQNAVDDLYSYFRFLRYAPYDIYPSFCSMIKFPINRNPAQGYRKIQAVLKTIMLRRTKGTLLDGEPIISLPPKFVELKKIDFSTEERDFYSRLEADSRAQFQEYADAGTVKENYVNILLMLLRLRQACDHPVLVKRYNSNSLWRLSVETANKLPQDKQLSLLNCLEASLALCGICNDPPEDAVVSICGHVFCSQCISEHLTGDDNQCPAIKCKTQLSMASVFPKATLNSCLFNHSSDDSSGCSSSDAEAFEFWSQSQPCDSSKIKAALEVLKSMCKVQCNTSKHIPVHRNFVENGDCPGISSDVKNANSFKNSPDCQNLSGNRSSDGVREKAIVFSQWTGMLDLIEVCLKNSSIQYRRLDGTMSVIARDKAVRDFNTLPEVSVMIMSLKAASLGLNMVAANHVLMLDLWWNPTTEDQAIDRAHRIGQTRPVTVVRLTVRDTVEDRILALQQKKREMVASAFGEDGSGGCQSRLTVADLKYLFMM